MGLVTAAVQRKQNSCFSFGFWKWLFISNLANQKTDKGSLSMLQSETDGETVNLYAFIL